MTEQEKYDFINNFTLKHDNLRRDGMVDIVKVILSVSSILLTVLATLEAPNMQAYSFCEHPQIILLRFLSYISLLLSISVCVYHLNYALNTFHTNMLELPKKAFENVNSVEQAWEKLKTNNSVAHPYLYKKSIPIIFSLFGFSLFLIFLKVFVN